MRKKQSKISQKLIQIFLILLFPLMILGTLIFHFSVSELERSIADVTQKSVDSLCRDLEQEINAIGNDLYTLINQSSEKDVRGFLAFQNSFSTPEYYLTIRNIRHLLQEIRQRHDLIEDIEIYYPSLSQSLSLNWGLQRQSGDRGAYLDAAVTLINGLAEVDGRLCVMYSLPQPAVRENIQILAIAFLSEDHLQSALSVPPYPDHPTALLYEGTNVTAGNRAWQQLSASPRADYQVFEVRSDILHSSIRKQLRTDEVFAVSKRLSRMMFFYVIAGAVLFIFYIFCIQRMVSHPVAKLIDGMARMRKGDLTFRIHPVPKTEEFARLTDGLHEMMDRLNELIEINYQQEIDNRRFELKHLQAQINPHFLYNSLYILRHMIECEDNENAEIMLRHLGDYFRYTASTDKMEIAFSQEYEHGKDYLAIQCIRFKGWLVSECEPLPAEWENLLVPKLIIQPLYENAVTHAIRQDGRELLIRTSFGTKDGLGMVCVEDSGIDLDDEKLQMMQKRLYAREFDDKVTALYNIHRRLQLRYGNDCTMRLSKSELGGLRVELYFALN